METEVWAASLLRTLGTAAGGALGLVAAGAGGGDWVGAGVVGAGAGVGGRAGAGVVEAGLWCGSCGGGLCGGVVGVDSCGGGGGGG